MAKFFRLARYLHSSSQTCLPSKPPASLKLTIVKYLSLQYCWGNDKITYYDRLPRWQKPLTMKLLYTN